MAVFFEDATTDKITVPNPLTYGAGTEFTFLFWFKRVATLGASKGWSKGATNDILVYETAAGGRFFSNVGRATTLAESKVDAVDILQMDVWECIGISYSEANGVSIYRGTLSSIIAELSYVTKDVGAGNTAANSGDLYVNNRGAANTLTIGGVLASLLMFNRRLTLNEMRVRQFRPFGGSGCLFHYVPFTTATIADLSGNARSGTGTGLSIVDHAPIKAFSYFDVVNSYVVSGGGSPFFQNVGGNITVGGTLINSIKHTLSSNIAPSGLLGTGASLFQSVGDATISISGALVNKIKHLLSSSINLSGALIVKIKYVLTSTITPTGLMNAGQKFTQSLSATLASLTSTLGTFYDEEGGFIDSGKRGHSIFGAISKRIGRKGKRRRRR